jgi:membrane protein YdbS with pleckstrin-like domain
MDNDEATVWEGSSRDMMSAASSGRLTSCRYRLTNKAVYFDEGLLSSNSQQVPLWAVRDVDVKQGMLQKARGVGDVIVHVEHSDYTGRSVVAIKDVEGPLTVRDHLNKYANKERREYNRTQKTQWYGRSS